MTEHLGAEWVRYIALLEVGIIIACFIGIHHGSKAVLPRVTYFAGWGILYILATLATALVVNVVGDSEPTTGLRMAIVALAPVAAGGIVAVLLIIRENHAR